MAAKINLVPVRFEVKSVFTFRIRLLFCRAE